MKAGSCYRECLASSLSSFPAALHPEYQAVAIISNLPTPSWFQKIISSSYGFYAFLTAAIATVVAGAYVGELMSKLNSALSQIVIVVVFVSGIGFYLLSLASIFFHRYYRNFTRALINTNKGESKSEATQERAVHRAFSRILIQSSPGPWIGNFVVRSEQFALYQLAVLRGGVEISSVRRSGSPRTDGDLLPPRKLRMWSSRSQDNG